MAKEVIVTEENIWHMGEDAGWQNCYVTVLKFGYTKPQARFFFKVNSECCKQLEIRKYQSLHEKQKVQKKRCVRRTA